VSFSDILFLYRARLRARTVLVQECFAILGIAVGVALLFASQVASASLSRSVAELSSQIVGSTQLQLDARGPDGFDERLLREVRAAPGVKVALPVLEQQANVIGPSGERSVDLIGTDPRFAHFAGGLLRRFSAAQIAAQQAIALPAPLAQAIGAGPLQPVRLQTGASVVTTLLGATLGAGDIGGLVHSPVALAPVGYAQRITGMRGRISRIFVQSEPGRRREMQRALTSIAAQGGVNLEPANFDSTLFREAAAPESQGEALFSAISALVGFMFALNAMLITVPARRRLIEDVALQGATRRMTVQILLFDAAVLGVLACIVGLALGEILSLVVFHSTPGYLSFAFPVGNDRIVTWQSVAIAICAAFAAAGVGVLWPVRDMLVARGRLGTIAARDSRGRVYARLGLGLACLGVTSLILFVYPRAAIIGNFMLIVALVCLLPFIFDWLVTIFEHAQRLFDGASPVLAVTELRTPPTRVRSLAIAATGAVAVFGTVAIQGTQSNLQRGLDTSARELDSSADVWVAPSGEANAFATTPFTSSKLASIAHIPGVKSVGLYRGSFLNWRDRRLWIIAPPENSVGPVPPGEIVKGNALLATERLRQGGWAIVSQDLASQHHLHLGQSFVLPSPRPTTFRVAALINNLGWPPGAVILPARDYARAWSSSAPSAVEVQIGPASTAANVRDDMRRLLGPVTGLKVETSAERTERHYALARQGLSRLTQIRLLVLIAAVLAVAGAMGSMIWQRRELVAFIKCQGFRKGVLWRWLLCESALLLGSGCLVGAVFGLYGQLLGSHALAVVTGFPMLFNVGFFIALLSFALVSVVAVAVAAVAGYLVVRVPPKAVSPAL
jgi:putative ABC transport system permease protein